MRRSVRIPENYEIFEIFRKFIFSIFNFSNSIVTIRRPSRLTRKEENFPGDIATTITTKNEYPPSARSEPHSVRQVRFR